VELQSSVVRRLSPRAALIDPDAAETLVQRMRRKGYTPRVSPVEKA
jgi:hypothetical protein